MVNLPNEKIIFRRKLPVRFCGSEGIYIGVFYPMLSAGRNHTCLRFAKGKEWVNLELPQKIIEKVLPVPAAKRILGFLNQGTNRKSRFVLLYLIYGKSAHTISRFAHRIMVRTAS